MLNRNATAFMRRGMCLSRIACSFCVLLVGALPSISPLAHAQAKPPVRSQHEVGPVPSEFSLSGTWVPYFHEDLLERGNGPELDNYVGLPITDGARKMALSWDPSRMTVEEHQCQVHVSPYMNRSPSRYAFSEIRDPETQLVIALQLYIENYQQTRTIWMDGRAHPPDYAPHTWMGFSTGKWEGNILTVYTTHIKQGFIRRNGIAESDRATMVEHYIRYGDIMTHIVIITDPVYLTEPFVRTNDFALAQYTREVGFIHVNPSRNLPARPRTGCLSICPARIRLSMSSRKSAASRWPPPWAAPRRCIRNTS